MNKKQDIRYYFFSFSNFIAALGGGMILGKGVGIIEQPFLQGGSILAFFVGTTLGLFFLQIIPKKISHTIARSFSILAGITALILLYIFKVYSINAKIYDIPAVIFFVLLSVRFGFWFYSRVLRASLAAGQQQKIAWVELGYYAGMIGGLIVWTFLGIEIGVAAALMIDACLQFSAGIIDLFVGNSSLAPSESKLKHPVISSNSSLSRYLIGSIIFLTIGIQVVIFSLAHLVSGYFTPFILAFYYLGASIAAIFCKKFQIYLEWNKNEGLSFAKIFSSSKIYSRGTSFIIYGILSCVSVAVSIFGIIYWHWGLESSIFKIEEIILLVLVFTAAFFYEILALAILDRIGSEGRSSNSQNILMHAYGFMGISAAISLWLLSILKNSTISLFFTLFSCVLFSVILTRRKESKFIL
jgi:hypothetical protein